MSDPYFVEKGVYSGGMSVFIGINPNDPKNIPEGDIRIKTILTTNKRIKMVVSDVVTEIDPEHDTVSIVTQARFYAEPGYKLKAVIENNTNCILTESSRSYSIAKISEET
jgi:hypothetical protein